jgi:fumarylacetoacetate (FAA) hydrolase family protein
MTPTVGPSFDPAGTLPDDFGVATLIGRVWRPAPENGPSVVVVRDGRVIDVSRGFPTIADLLAHGSPAKVVRAFDDGEDLGAVDEIIDATFRSPRTTGFPVLLAPVDLQAIKAAGVTFVKSMLERVIEERTRGDRERANAVREEVGEAIGGDLASVIPGSPSARRVKEVLVARGFWSPYLEVGIGPDAEVFTKAQPMSAVGTGAEVGIHPASTWNNPEPEVVLVVDPRGRIVGATLGNDVNLRDFEGRSALLLGRAKDNNASCALGPFLRLFDDAFTIEQVRAAVVTLDVRGTDGFTLVDHSDVSQISRSFEELAAQTVGACHQYPDGLVLFTGTMFAPTADRGAPGAGFSHLAGDVVRITSPRLGSLVNRVVSSDRAAPWNFGARALMHNLSSRGLLSGKART